MMVEWNEYELQNVCSRLSSGKNISAKNIENKGTYPVYGGNGLRGYTETYNFKGDCAIIGRQGAYCGNVRYFKGTAYMTEHAIVACANENHNTSIYRPESTINIHDIVECSFTRNKN